MDPTTPPDTTRQDSTKQQSYSALRTVLAAAAGYFAGKGWLPTDAANELVAAAMVLIPLVWGWWQKKQAEQKTQAREHIAVQAGVDAKASRIIEAPHEVVSLAQAQAIIKEFSPSPLKGA